MPPIQHLICTEDTKLTLVRLLTKEHEHRCPWHVWCVPKTVQVPFLLQLMPMHLPHGTHDDGTWYIMPEIRRPDLPCLVTKKLALSCEGPSYKVSSPSQTPFQFSAICLTTCVSQIRGPGRRPCLGFCLNILRILDLKALITCFDQASSYYVKVSGAPPWQKCQHHTSHLEALADWGLVGCPAHLAPSQSLHPVSKAASKRPPHVLHP
jgi:hypothetical protein